MATTSPTKTRTAPKRAAQGDGRKSGLPNYGLRLVRPGHLTTKQLCGLQTFGNCRLRIGAIASEVSDSVALKVMRDADRLIAANEKAKGVFLHREQMGWLFRKLVQTADALGVAVSDARAFKALNARVRNDELAQAMLFAVWSFTLIQRDAADDAVMQRDPLPVAIRRARAVNAGREFKSRTDQLRARVSRAQFALLDIQAA